MKLPPVTTTVSASRVRDFAASIGEDSPVFHDVTAAVIPLPPTILFGIGAELEGDAALDAFGLRPAQVLHVEQEFRYHRPVHAGEELTFRSVASSFDRRGSAFVVLETEITRSSELVAELRQVLMA
ncbi:MaoC family dehydratase N-terminal domain-containing protein [Amycolatopsis sp. NPDC102389]|uniref:FAS1-like dehydratase domain-containing protein n=1 Tax=Amycolatopsis sp. NPDC102389 TaxID=3363941 RepID=UPI00380553AB